MSFPMGGGAAADCGPVNPMAGLMKQFQQDRSLQQDRFTAEQHAESSKAAFRSRENMNGGMDRQFADDFMSDGAMREQQHLFEFGGLRNELETIEHGPPMAQQQHMRPMENWSNDFMDHRQVTPMHAAPVQSSAQFNDFESFQQQQAGPSAADPSLMHRQPYHYMPSQRFFDSGLHAQPMMQHQTPVSMTEHDKIAFEQAFDDAAKQMEKEQPAAQEDWASEFAEKERAETENNDALARTAAMLLDSVNVNDNPKFQKSQFMSLMQKLRDREVHVEGDNLVETKGKGKAASSDWASDFQHQQPVTQQQQQQQQGEQQGRDWMDDYLAHAGDPQSGNMWSADFAKKMERGWTEQQAGDQQQDLSEEDMQKLYGKGTEFQDWVEQYNHNIAHLKTSQDKDWDSMQKDWDRFADEHSMGYRAAHPEYDNYSFVTNNPYLLHTGHLDDQPQSLSDSILALEARAQLETNNADAWQQLGLKQQENERDPAAIAALRKAVSLNPALLDGWLALAVSYTNENCRADAYDSLEQWIHNNPAYQHLLASSSKATTDHERHAFVTNVFLEAARSSPGSEMDANVQIGLGVLFNMSEEYDKAIDCFKAAVTSRPQDYLLWNKLGATLANSKDTAGAIDAYFNALEINPAYVRARYNLAISCINLNQYQEAAEHLLTALAQQHQDAMGSSTMASAPMVDERGTIPSLPSGMSENVWDSLRMVMFMMKREDLAAQCERRNLGAFRSEFDF
ncbi:TPR-like protein [Hesseltinella vesiculosa]|uniref:TPR-like protein n=1 Tax=Hesseltinella vesiculosa TaxID=101127 RepID=A0A1X2GZ97_9FUNG|nr:TPR-like protein [Hesseltinella vesiculosa]